MTDRDFLAAIIANPADDAPRLVYADWLEERDDPRGEFIRVQIELARRGGELRASCRCNGCGRRRGPFGQTHNGPCQVDRELRPLRAREQKLMALHGRQWADRSALDTVREPTAWTFSRGLISRVKCSVTNWRLYGGRIVRATPLEVAEMSGCRPLAREIRSYESRDESYRWSRPRYGDECMTSWDLPSWLMDLMTSVSDDRGFPTAEAAMAALSVAAIEWAREQPE